jgi:hypothetical protein
LLAQNDFELTLHRNFTRDFLVTVAIFTGITVLGPQTIKATIIAATIFPLVELAALG